MSKQLDLIAKICAFFLILGILFLAIDSETEFRAAAKVVVVIAGIALVLCRFFSKAQHNSDLDSTMDSAGGDTLHHNDLPDS